MISDVDYRYIVEVQLIYCVYIFAQIKEYSKAQFCAAINLGRHNFYSFSGSKFVVILVSIFVSVPKFKRYAEAIRKGSFGRCVDLDLTSCY